MATIAPSPESSSLILPATASSLPGNDAMCDVGGDDTAAAMMMQTDDDNNDTGGAPPTPTRRVAPDESTQGALDALAALAAASSAVSSVSTEPPPSHSQQEQQMMTSMITPHQTSSDDDSEIMPPPPPREPTTSNSISNTNIVVDMPSPSFTFLHDSTTFSNMSTRATGVGVGGRLRSASNPEGMEKWDLYSRRNDRQHFVLPSSILEEELASTRRVLGEVVDDDDDDDDDEGDYNAGNSAGGVGRVIHGFTPQPPLQQESNTSSAAFGFQQHWASTTNGGGVRRSKRGLARLLGTSPDSVSSDLGGEEEVEAKNKPPSSMKNSTFKSNNSIGSTKSNNIGNNSKSRKKVAPTASPPELISKSPPPNEDDEEDFDESTLEPEELLRRARSRLLEDLSEGSGGVGGNNGTGLNGDNKGSVLILPHSLSKYKEVYNKNGRIGIYTPAERAAIIQKFNAKRARRVWNKKIRYNCRKNLADRRMRVKGRFVKRSVEASANSPPPPEDPSAAAGGVASEIIDIKNGSETTIKPKDTLRSGSPPTSGSPLTTVNEHEEQQQQQQPMDEDMPDVNDEEAGFDPSEDMPYRRTRRYTIT